MKYITYVSFVCVANRVTKLYKTPLSSVLMHGACCHTSIPLLFPLSLCCFYLVTKSLHHACLLAVDCSDCDSVTKSIAFKNILVS